MIKILYQDLFIILIIIQPIIRYNPSYCFILIILLSLLFPTFSIVAVDTNTKEVGSAGGSCIANSIIISDIHPGTGVIHTQSYYLPANQSYASSLMDEGYSPDEICYVSFTNKAVNECVSRVRKKFNIFITKIIKQINFIFS